MHPQPTQPRWTLRRLSLLLVLCFQAAAFAAPPSPWVSQPVPPRTLPFQDETEQQDQRQQQDETSEDSEPEDDEDPYALTEAEKRLGEAVETYLARPSKSAAREQHYRTCEDLFQAILDEFPDSESSVDALFYRSQCQRLLGRPRIALEGFEEFLVREDDNLLTPDVLHYKGHCEQDLLLWTESIPTFLRVVNDFPDSPAVPACLFDAGLSHRELEQFDEGVALWERLIAEHPSNNYASRARKLMETQRPPLVRLKDLHEEYRAALEKWKKAPYKQKKPTLEELEKVLIRFGDVRCKESEHFLLKLLKKERGDLQAAAVEPSLKVGGARHAKLLLGVLAEASEKLRLEILNNLQRRHLEKHKMREVEALLSASKSNIKQAAVRMFERVGTQDAARLLVSAYTSGAEGSLSKDATKTNSLIMRSLRGIRDKAALSYLADKVLANTRQSPDLRAGVANALGFCGSKDVVSSLRAALNDRSPKVAAAAAEALGRLGAQSATDELIAKLGGAHGVEFQRAAVETLGRLDPSAAEEQLLTLSRKPDVPLRTLCIAALGKIQSEPAFQRILEALADPAWQVRKAALRVAGNYRRKLLIDALIDRLGIEDGVLRPPVVKLLIKMTGVDRGPKPGPWREYWEVARDHFDEDAKDEDGNAKGNTYVKKANPDRATPRYFGVEIISRKLAFIIDVSGSMSGKVEVQTEEGTSEETKISLARAELIQAISSLRKGTRFNIVRFSGSFSSYSPKLVLISKKNRKKATSFARGLAPGGGTNIYDSLESVLKANEVDTIYLLSDGAPSAGKHTDPATILQEIKRLNKTSQVAIHTIALGYESGFMRDLAAQNDGEYIVAGQNKDKQD